MAGGIIGGSYGAVIGGLGGSAVGVTRAAVIPGTKKVGQMLTSKKKNRLPSFK